MRHVSGSIKTRKLIHSYFSSNRREKAIRFVTNFRAYAFTIYLGHALFAWDPVQDVDIRWLKHSDEILSELVGIGDGKRSLYLHNNL